MRRLSNAAVLLFVASVAPACSRADATGEQPKAASGAASPLAASANANVSASASAKAALATKSTVAIDFEGGFDGCTLSHRGVLLDLGDATTRARTTGSRLVPPDVDVREHDGASWASVHARSLELAFVSTAEIAGGVAVEARIRGGLAKNASVYLNGRPLGVLPLAKGETKIVSTRVPAASIYRGANELLLRFNGGTRATRDQLAEIDWIRVGPIDGDAPYSAPTRGDALTTVTIGGIARRGLSLRAPGSARCSGFVPNGAVLDGYVGASGGEAEAEVRVLVDRAEPRVVGSVRVGGPQDPPGWRPISLPLGDVGTIAAVELVAKNSAKGARVVFSQVRVVAADHARAAASAAAEPALFAPARGVILVVMGTTSRKQIAPYGGTIATPELAQLAEGGAVFDAHRGVSSFANGAMASMLSGALTRQHGMTDTESTLAASVFTIAEAARQAGVVTAMFTANPTTTAAFGFARGFETFTPRMPGDDVAATAVFDDVAHWLDSHKEERFFVVVHARGGHPPWDVTSEELKELPPANYSGSLEPKRAGEGLAKARRGGARALVDADRERAFALHAKAVATHDAALGKLVAHVRSIGREADTAWIVTSDVGVDAGAHVPFLEEDDLDEGTLALPLVIRAPGAKLRARVQTATSSVDVARTVLEALALRPPAQLRGEALWTLAAPGHRTLERPVSAATATRFSVRWAGFALVGARDRELRLCNLLLDPDCVSDVRPTHPLAAEVMHALAFDELLATRAAPPPPKLAPDARADAPFAAALRAWGR